MVDGPQKLAASWYANNGYGAPENLEDTVLTTYVQAFTYCCGDYSTAFDLNTFRIAIYNSAAYTNFSGQKLQGSNDTTNGSDGTWDDIITFQDGVNMSAPATYPGWVNDFDVASTVAYRFYRLTGDGTTGQVISEWELFPAADAIYTLIDNANIVATDQSSAYSSNTADKMFDGLLGAGAYWLTATGAALPQWASWDYGTNDVGIVGQYEMQCNSIPEPLRMPQDWTLEGSDNNIDWDVIDTVVGETAWTGSEKRLYTCDVITTQYRYYRVVVTANNGDAYTQIGELYLYSVTIPTGAVKTYTPIANGGGYTNHTLRSRHSLSTAGFVGPSTRARINVPAQFGDTEWTFVELWIGKSTVGGNTLDMAGAVQVLFSGAAGATVPAGGLWSDWVDIVFADTDDLIISACTTHGAPPYVLDSANPIIVATAQAVGNVASAEIFSTAGNDYHFGSFGFEIDVTAIQTSGLRAFVDMPYGDLVAFHLIANDMQYSILLPILASIDQIYGIKLAAMLSMYYGDAPVLRQIVKQYYGDCPILRRAMEMKYGDLLMLRRSVEMPYVIPKELRSIIEARYSIAGEAVRAFIDQGYDLLENNLLRRRLDMPYLVQGDSQEQDISVSVAIGGVDVKFSHVNIEANLDSYFISAEIHINDESAYLQIEKRQSFVVTVTIDGSVEQYRFIVESKRRSRPAADKTNYIITAVSPAVLLSAPWSRPLLQEFAAGQAQDIINDLAGDVGPVDWQIGDFPVLPDTLYANDEDRRTVIRKLTQSTGAGMRSNPDGSIRIEPWYPVSTNKWADVEPDYYLTDAVNFISQDETPVMNPGYNKYLVGNQLTADDRLWTEQRDITETIKEVLAFQTPWDGSMVLELDHSGGDWVYLPEYMGVVEEIYPPLDQPAERVEFVAGFSNTSRPIYAVPAVDWVRAQLGAVSYSEDGQLEAELKTGPTDGYSLAEIRYLTRYHLWRVRDDVSEDVQYILRVVEEVAA